MRRDETVARILLIISIVNVAFAAPAALRQGHLDVAEGETAASVKRGETNFISSAPSTSSAGWALQLPQSGPEAQEDKHLTSSAPASLAGERLPSQLSHSNSVGSTQEISGAKSDLSTLSAVGPLQWQGSSGSSSFSDDSMEWAKPSDGVPMNERPKSEIELATESDRYQPALGDNVHRLPPTDYSTRPLSPIPEANNFFNDEAKKSIKAVAAMGAIIGISAGVVYGVNKIKVKHSSRGYVSSLFPLSPADI
jgi:hypothetical protein